MPRPLRILVPAVLALILLAGPVTLAVQTGSASSADSAAIPDDALRVCETGCAFSSIDDALKTAVPGATIAVEGGTWAGPIEIAKSVRLIGIGNPVIDGGSHGTVVRITAPDVTVQGFTIQHSGSNFDKEDSAVYIEAQRVQILDNRLLDTLFGVNAATAHDSVIARNTIVGKDVDMGVRGDGIKVWYSHRIKITGNEVSRSRDLLVWYSNDVVVSDNHVTDGRYGFHFMNSDNGIAEHNRLVNNSVAIYLMYGRNFVIRDNLLQGSRGPSGHGLGLKEIDGVLVEGNIIYDNRIGIFIDNSPLSPNVYSHFRNNLIAYNDQGFGVLPSSRNNILSHNSMIDNLEQIAILGGGKLGKNQWSEDGAGNFWSDYAGIDRDGDGIGDVPYRSEQLSEHMMDTWPALQLFRFSVAETAVDFGARAIPMFRMEPKLTDEHPLMAPVIPAGAPRPEGASDPNRSSLWAVALLACAGGALAWGVRGTRYRPQAHPDRLPSGTAVPTPFPQPIERSQP